MNPAKMVDIKTHTLDRTPTLDYGGSMLKRLLLPESAPVYYGQ